MSDHSGTIYPSLAAVALGANIIEVHTVFSKECFGPDVHSSVITTELFELVRGIRLIETAISFPVDKNQQALEMEELRKLFGKSLYANCDLLEGSMLLEQDVSLKKPGTGIPASRFKEFIGKKIKRACRKNQQLNENHFYD